MGTEIQRSNFSRADFAIFAERLSQETGLLKQWFSDGAFARHSGVCGLELEGWLLGRDWRPVARNEEFLERVDDPLVVPELSRFNFEINTRPQPAGAEMFTRLHEQLREVWQRCESHATALGLVPLHIGTLPTLDDDVMTLANMSPLQRYYALNREILRHRQGSPLHIDIAGARERLQVTHHDVMTEAATTSLQIHIQLDPAQAVRIYNAAQILAAPMVAVAANAPFLFGHDLWADTRVPLFEQSVAAPAFHDAQGNLVERVTFGTRYLESSVLELYEENLSAFPVLLPLSEADEPERMRHLRLHNGTIWRWNRPLVDFDDTGQPTLRLEHRVCSAGPTLADEVANIVLFYGLVHYLAGLEQSPESRLPIEMARANFYEAARLGLGARVFWLDGHEHDLRELLLDMLLPACIESLEKLGLAASEVQTWIEGIILPRIESARTGTDWQRRFVARHGRDFPTLVRVYHERQQQQWPVHQWTI